MNEEELQILVDKALVRAFNLGQTYWYQADSESYKQHKKADVTKEQFGELRDEIKQLLSNFPTVEISS